MYSVALTDEAHGMFEEKRNLRYVCEDAIRHPSAPNIIWFIENGFYVSAMSHTIGTRCML